MDDGKISVNLLQTRYLLEIERAKLDRETNREYTAEGLQHLKEAGKIQFQLSAVTTGEVSAKHLRMSKELLQEVLRHMQRLGLTDEKAMVQSPPTVSEPTAVPAPQANADGRKASDKPDTSKSSKQAAELEDFNINDYIVKPGAVTVEDAMNGNPDVVEALKQAIYDDFQDKFPNLEGYTGVLVRHRLLYGPPGSGKTFICKALATYLDQMYPAGESCFFLLSGRDVKAKYQGVAEHRIGAVFKAAEEYTCSVICIDEVESLCPSRSADEKYNMTTTLLELIDGVQGKAGSLVILATNYPDRLDDALISRIGNRDFVDYPAHPALEAFLWKNKSIAYGLGDTEEKRERRIKKLAAAAEEKHFSFRNMNVLCDEIMKRMKAALLAQYKDGSKEVTHFPTLPDEKIDEAFQSVKTDFNQELYAHLLAYRDGH